MYKGVAVAIAVLGVAVAAAGGYWFGQEPAAPPPGARQASGGAGGAAGKDPGAPGGAPPEVPVEAVKVAFAPMPQVITAVGSLRSDEQVWHGEHDEWRLILRSANAPATALADADGYSRGEWNGRHWRFFVAADPRHENRVLVGEDLGIRRELGRKIAWQTLLPFLIAVPTLALLLFIAVRQGLGPLRRLARDLERRSPERLDPITLSDRPRNSSRCWRN